MLALEPDENEVWAVTGCSGRDSTGCLQLIDSPATTDVWSIASPQPRFALSVATKSAPFVFIERAPVRRRVSKQKTRCLPPNPVGGHKVSPEGQLLFTSNNLGRSWQSLRAPCSGIQDVRSIDGLHVWVLCSVPCCTQNYVKSVWTSAERRSQLDRALHTAPMSAGSIPSPDQPRR